MAKTYITIAGDTWDSIAYALYGDEYKMTDLQMANLDHSQVLVFDAGVVLVVPDVEATNTVELPEWNR